MFHTILLVVLLLPLPAESENPPRAVITGPTEGVPGDLIELGSEESIGNKRRWYVEPARFADGKPTFKLSKDGSSVWLASRPGVYRAELVVSNEDGPDRVVWIVTISGGSDPGPPPPGPPLPPDPAPLPPGRFGLANFVRSQVLGSVPADKRGLCSAFSGNFGTVATQIAAGTIKTVAEANDKVKKLNQATAGTAVEYWKANALAPLAAKLNDLLKSGAIKLPSDIQAAFEEIRDGFASAGN